MKYSERLFAFRCVTYSARQMEKIDEQEKDLGMEQKLELPFCVAKFRLPWDEIVGWGETITRDFTVEDVNEQGYSDYVIIFTKTLGEYVGAHSITEFEKIYNEHGEKLTTFQTAEENKLLNDLEKQLGGKFLVKINDNIALD